MRCLNWYVSFLKNSASFHYTFIQFCNSRRLVPATSQRMHELQCSKTNFFCSSCDQTLPLLVRDRALHEHVLHGAIECECGLSIPMFAIPRHMKVTNILVSPLIARVLGPAHFSLTHSSTAAVAQSRVVFARFTFRFAS